MPEEGADYRHATHIVFTCGHLSSYHRHDDDTAFTLYAFGRDWLIDSGLYLHESKDTYRQYVRAALAHNVSQPLGARVHRASADNETVLSAQPRDGGGYVVTGKTSMFEGYTYERRLSILSPTRLEIEDKIRSAQHGVSQYASCFQVPADLSIERKSDSVICSGDAGVMEIRLERGELEDIVVRTGENEPQPYGWVSWTYGKLEPCHHVMFKFADGEALDAAFSIALSRN